MHQTVLLLPLARAQNEARDNYACSFGIDGQLQEKMPVPRRGIGATYCKTLTAAAGEYAGGVVYGVYNILVEVCTSFLKRCDCAGGASSIPDLGHLRVSLGISPPTKLADHCLLVSIVSTPLSDQTRPQLCGARPPALP